MKPQPPVTFHNPLNSLDLPDISKHILALEDQRQAAYDLSRKFQVALLQAQRDPTVDLQPFLDQISPTTIPRLANLSNRMEEYAKFRTYQHFLEHGTLLAQSACANVTDEEYLGACVGLAHELQRYALGRATVRDAASVEQACQMVQEIHSYLLGLDFRNGPLRRKYDSTKYALRGLETILYELAVTSSLNVPRPTKRSRTDAELLPVEELKALQERMVHRDDLREQLIKRCRDGQKAAKQSIFALHRGDMPKAMQLLEQCRSCIVELLPITKEEPPLRTGGSFSAVMEEYAEAKLFAAWLEGVDTGSAFILKPPDFDVELELEEYLGGLCDLTSEVGRFAVQRGTARDVKGVQLCLHTNSDIAYALQSMERLPGGLGKKMDALRRSVEKLERMLYEMSLSEAAGGRNVKSDVDMAAQEEPALE